MFKAMAEPAPLRRRSSIRPTYEDRNQLSGAVRPGESAVPLGVDMGVFPLWNATGLPRPEDISQGDVGDCWALATLASLAHTYPEHLKSLVTVLPTGRYLVQLDRPVEVGPMVDSYHREGDETAVRSMYADFSKGAWVAILEKALARRDPLSRASDFGSFRETYDTINSGKAESMMRLLGWTGAFTKENDEWPGLASAGMAVLTALRERQLVTCTIAVDGGLHACAVISMFPGGIKLYDPHGRFLDMSNGEFADAVRRLTFSGPGMPSSPPPAAEPVVAAPPRPGPNKGRLQLFSTWTDEV